MDDKNKGSDLIVYHPYLTQMLETACLRSLEDVSLYCDKEIYSFLINCVKNKDIEKWNKYREKTDFSSIYLCGADLRNLMLDNANFKNAHFEFANFYRSSLVNAFFRNANLQNAYISGADCRDTDFGGCNLASIRARGIAISPKTSIWDCSIDNDSDFTSSNIVHINIDQKLLKKLMDNIESISNNVTDKYYGNPIILHLSDLHFGNEDDAKLWSSQIIQDLVNKDGLNIPYLTGIVISGDVTTTGNTNEYSAASIFFSLLRYKFKFPREHIVIVPGNHDMDWNISKASYGIGNKIVNESLHKTRFESFANFHKELTGKDYSLNYEDQGILYQFQRHKLLFIGFNSSWKIDNQNRTEADINKISVSNIVDNLLKNEDLFRNTLKIGVWHHPFSPEDDGFIRDRGFLDRIISAGVTMSMHGHIHMAAKGAYHQDGVLSGSKIEDIGAGTFGAPVREWKPGYPLQYNLLKFNFDELPNEVTIETRCREKLNGVWRADARWILKKGDDPKPRYTISVNS